MQTSLLLLEGVKGNDLALKNFAYSFSSGFGKYTVDFTKYTGSNTTSNSISIYKEAGINKGFATIAYSQLESDIPSYSIEIKGLDSGQILYYYRNNEGLEKNVTYNKDGIYELPICYKEGEKGISAGFTINSVNNITITQLPSAYEGALVFDGVDDYGICTGLPILDDYTVICRREIINKDYYSVASKSTVLVKAHLFLKLFKVEPIIVILLLPIIKLTYIIVKFHGKPKILIMEVRLR